MIHPDLMTSFSLLDTFLKCLTIIWYLSEEPGDVKQFSFKWKKIGPKFKDMCFGANRLYKSQGVKNFKAFGIK